MNAKTSLAVIWSTILIFVQIVSGQNIVLNPGFENGDGELPDHWLTSVSEGSAVFSWTSVVAHEGAKSINIIHVDSASSSFYQELAILPGFEYRLSAYLKTENVSEGSVWFEGGAQIVITGDVVGDWWDNMTDKIVGTSDWTKVTLDFTTTNDASVVQIHCSLGAGLKSTGRVWFDDIVVEGTESIGSFFRNGGFEDDTLILNRDDPDWDGGWFIEFDEFNSFENGKVTASLDTTVYHSGRQSLKLYCVPNHATGWIQLMQNGGPYPEGLVDGEYYKISGWIKTAGDVSHIRMRCGKEGDIGAQLAGENDWTYREGIIQFDQSFYSAWGFLGLTFFKENTANSGTVWYDDISVEHIESSVAPDPAVPIANVCELIGNYPNPFNPNTTFTFTLNRSADITLTVFNITGQKVDIVLDKYCQAGVYKVDWHAGSEMSSGIYFYELRVGKDRRINRMVLLR